MRVSFLSPFFLNLALLLSSATGATAQDVDAPPAPATLNAPEDTPPKPAASTPTERSAARRAQNEMRLRAMMSDFGIEEAPQQDALIGYLAEDEAGKSAIRVAARRLMTAVRAGTTPERTRELIAVYKAAIDADRERRRAAQNSLDAKIGFSLNPRLEATLWLLGILGEGQIGPTFVAPIMRPPRNPPSEGARDGGREIGREFGPREAGVRRGGQIRGVVTGKSEGWVEVRADGGMRERYLPFWAEGEVRYDPISGAPLNKEEVARMNLAVLENLTRVKIGERVQLDWIWSGRKRVVRLDILAPEAALPPGGDENPNTPNNEALPVPVYPAANAP